jgi:hypothetical protein
MDLVMASAQHGREDDDEPGPGDDQPCEMHR